MPARSSVARATQPPSSAAEDVASAPPKLPIGVRTAPASSTGRSVIRGRAPSALARAPGTPGARARGAAHGGALDRLAAARGGDAALLALERARRRLLLVPDRGLQARPLGIVRLAGLEPRALGSRAAH